MIEILTTYFQETWHLLNEAAPWMLFGFLMAGLIKALVPDDFIAKHLGKNGATSVIKASAMGVPLPLCSCGVVPAATGLRKQGASKGATAAFMISTPETGADSVAMTWAMLDPIMTVFRPLAAFVTATVAGLAINFLPENGKTPAAESSLPMHHDAAGCGCASGCCASGNENETGTDNHPHGRKPPLTSRLRNGLHFAFGEMLQDIGSWMVVGILLAGLISVFVPDDFFQSYLSNEWTSMLIMLVAGVPLYICATSSTPIAATMALKGLSPGAALVFLLAGPATNAATIAVASKVLGRRAAAVYVASIAISSLVLGWLVNRLYFAIGLDVSSWIQGPHEGDANWFTALCSILLLILIARPWLARSKKHGHGCGCGHDHGHTHGSTKLNGSDFVVK